MHSAFLIILFLPLVCFAMRPRQSRCEQMGGFALRDIKMKEYICVQCGKSIFGYYTVERKFCSNKCRGAWLHINKSGQNSHLWKPIKNLRPSNKQSLRIHMASKYKSCYDCGSTSNLHVHHVDHNPKNNSESNLVLLRKKCHANRHLLIGEIQLSKLILSTRTYSRLDEKECPICKNKFIPKRRTKKTCSRKCGIILLGKQSLGRAPWNKGSAKINLSCDMCHLEFSRNKGRINNRSKSGHRFCSKSCQIKFFQIHQKHQN